jgi:class 3 adenylate cyclase
MMFAVDCFKALRTVNEKYSLGFELRVGIHNGPVVAGVLGLKRLAYDVWGDTVNVSSPTEACSVVSFQTAEYSYIGYHLYFAPKYI